MAAAESAVGWACASRHLDVGVSCSFSVVEPSCESVVHVGVAEIEVIKFSMLGAGFVNLYFAFFFDDVCFEYSVAFGADAPCLGY